MLEFESTDSRGYVSGITGLHDQLLKFVNEVVARIGNFSYSMDIFVDPESDHISLRIWVFSANNMGPVESEEAVLDILINYMDFFENHGVSAYTIAGRRTA